MPKAPRPREEIEAIREEIIDTALSLIISDGFNNLSMRKIAARLGITATTIYNYVASKDELNLMIRMKGFEILYGKLAQSLASNSGLIPQLSAMIRAYSDFGITFPDYYDVMFSLATPKYTDYIGTDIEDTALLEKQTSIRCFTIFSQLLEGYIRENSLHIDKDYAGYMIMRMWSDLHGIISLYNSRVLYEVNEESRKILDRRIEDVIASALHLKTLIDSGEAQSLK